MHLVGIPLPSALAPHYASRRARRGHARVNSVYIPPAASALSFTVPPENSFSVLSFLSEKETGCSVLSFLLEKEKKEPKKRNLNGEGICAQAIGRAAPRRTRGGRGDCSFFSFGKRKEGTKEKKP